MSKNAILFTKVILFLFFKLAFIAAGIFCLAQVSPFLAAGIVSLAIGVGLKMEFKG